MSVDDKRVKRSASKRSTNNIDASREKERRKNRKRKRANRTINRLAFLLTIIIVMYTIYGFGVSALRKSLDVTTIESGEIESAVTVEAKIMRNEKVTYSKFSGNTKYFIHEGEKVGKEEFVIKVGDSKAEIELENKINQIDEEIMKIQNKRKEVSNYKPEIDQISREIDASIQKYNKLSGTNYNYNVYDLKSEIQSKLNLKGTLVLNESAEKTASYREEKSNYQNKLEGLSRVIKAEEAGVISYYVDGFEDVYKPENYASILDNDNKNIDKLVASAKKDKINKQEPAFKIVDGYEWYVTCYVDIKKSKDWEVGKAKRVRFPKIDNSTLKAELVHIEEGKKGNRVLFKFTEQIERYLQFRNVSLSIIESKNNGFKLPRESVINKSMIVLPKGYTKSENIKTYVKKLEGTSKLKQEINVYYEDEQYIYVKNEDGTINIGDRLLGTSDEIFTVEKVDKVSGVYVVMGNIAQFRIIKIIGENENFIVADDTKKHSLKVYDNVINNPKNVKDNEFVK